MNDFLKYSQSLLTHDMVPILEQQFQRVSPSSANLIRLLALETTTVSLNQLQAQGIDLLKDIQSLRRRAWIADPFGIAPGNPRRGW